MTQNEKWFADKLHSVTKANRDQVVNDMQTKLDSLPIDERDRCGGYLEGVLSNT